MRESKRKLQVLFSTSHRQMMSGHFPGRRALVGRVVAPEEKHFKKPPLNAAPFSSFLLGFIAELWSGVEWNGMEHLFGHLG